MKVEIDEFTVESLKNLESPGCLLVSSKKNGAHNVMTIGWGLIGVFWRMPIFLVAVRHSRFTHEFVEDTGEFTVNIPDEGMEKTVGICGAISGRDHDKFRECKMTPVKGKGVNVPVIKECKIHYECKVVYKLEMKPEQVPADVKTLLYSKGDFHTLYFGKIVTVY